ncbi:hypothetical protein V6N13_084984 [Hibiscus sabdariffa]
MGYSQIKLGRRLPTKGEGCRQSSERRSSGQSFQIEVFAGEICLEVGFGCLEVALKEEDNNIDESFANLEVKEKSTHNVGNTS